MTKYLEERVEFLTNVTKIYQNKYNELVNEIFGGKQTMLNIRTFRRSGLPVKLETIEIEALANLPIDQAIEYERALRKSGRQTEVISKVKNLMELAEVLDQVSRYSTIQLKMVGKEDVLIEILDSKELA